MMTDVNMAADGRTHGARLPNRILDVVLLATAAWRFACVDLPQASVWQSQKRFTRAETVRQRGAIRTAKDTAGGAGREGPEAGKAQGCPRLRRVGGG